MQYLSPQQMAVIHYYLRTRLRRILTPNSYFNHLNRNAASDYSVGASPGVASETWTNDRYSKGNIIIKSGKSLTVACLLGMAGGTSIIVEKGGRLIVAGSGTITNISGHTWKGVRVCGDITKDQSINNLGFGVHQGLISIENGGTISKAGNAVTNYTMSANGNIDYGSTGGIIIANGGNFIDNTRDVEFLKYPNFTSASIFTSCNFKTSGPINDTLKAFVQTPIPPHMHASIWGVNGIKFRGCYFEYAAGNTYSVHGLGIYSIDAKFSVTGLCASNAGFCSVPGLFKNLDRGIVVHNANDLAVINVSHCKFENIKTDGIYIYNMKAPVIESNYFKVPGNGQGAGNCGVYLHYTKNYVVKNNTFEEIGNTQSNTGIYANKSEIGTHEIYRNIFSGFYTAINALNNNSGNFNPINGLKMNCNDFTTSANLFDIAMHGNGTAFNSPSVMHKQGENIQPDAKNLVRNKYGSSNCGNWGKWYGAGAGTHSLVIQHGCNSNSLSAGVTDPSACSVSILSVTPFPILFNYGLHCESFTKSRGGSSYTSEGERLENINTYLAELLLQGSSVDKFELQATATAKLNYFLMDSLPGAMDTVVKMLLTNPGQMEDADLQLIFACFSKGNYSLATQYTDALGATRYDWKQLCKKLIDLYQDPEGIFNLKNNNSGYLSFMTDLAAAEGKDGNEIAKALLKATRNIEYDILRLYPAMEGGLGRQMANVETLVPITETENIAVFPNPATDLLTVQYRSNSASDADIEVRDLLGKVVFRTVLKSNQANELSLQDLSSGVYILIVSNNKTIVYKTKLIKQD